MMIITIIVIFMTVVTWVDLVDCGVREATVLDGSPSYSRPTFATLEILLRPRLERRNGSSKYGVNNDQDFLIKGPHY